MYTKGPWEFNKQAMMIYADDKRVAKIPLLHSAGNRQRSDRDEEEANARLIAASPKLLEMLTDIAKELDTSAETVGGMSTEMCRFFCDNIRDFISKATG